MDPQMSVGRTRTATEPLSQRDQQKASALGLTSSTGLVVGSVVGTGVFTMPAVLAGAGTMGILVLAVVAVGATLLAVLFGQLTRRVPNSDGGLYAYARHEFGDLAGYLVGWSYWISSWAGNAAIVASWVFYVDALLGLDDPSGLAHWTIALVGLWVPAIVNLLGVRQMAWFQNLTVVLKFLPLLFVGIIGWLFVDTENYGPFNASGGSVYTGIGIAAGVALFSFIGVEAASITAKRVVNPRINVGRASLIGTGASALLYVLVTAAVMGLVPHDALAGTGAPFVDAFKAIFPGSSWAGTFIAAIAVISGIGALNGWTLIVTETSRAIAEDDLFPRPFTWTDRNGTAWFGIVVGTALPSLLMLWRYMSGSGLTVFTYLVNLTVMTVAIAYFFSALAQLTYLVSRRRRVQGWCLARDLAVAATGVAFSMWVTFAAGYQVVYQGLAVILVGLVLYAFLNARRQRLGEASEPVESPSEAPEWPHQKRSTRDVPPAAANDVIRSTTTEPLDERKPAMSTGEPGTSTRQCTITITVNDTEDRIHAIARMNWHNRDLVGVGRTRPGENFPDSHSEQLSMSRALSDLVAQLDTCTPGDIGTVARHPAPAS